MKGMDLLNALGRVQDTYVVSAGDFRENRDQPRRLALRRAWLIAALIALLLMLVGCAVVYVLRMQDMKVGEYSFYIPTEYDDHGNVIPVQTQEPITLLSVQGTNMEALSEWVDFTNSYDPDKSIAGESDLAAKSGSPWDIPENYNFTYGCYSQEMVDKLN